MPATRHTDEEIRDIVVAYLNGYGQNPRSLRKVSDENGYKPDWLVRVMHPTRPVWGMLTQEQQEKFAAIVALQKNQNPPTLAQVNDQIARRRATQARPTTPAPAPAPAPSQARPTAPVPGSSDQSRAPIPVPPHLIVRSNAPAGSSGRPQAPIPVPQHLIAPSQGDPAGPVPAPVPFAGAAGMHPVAQQAGDAERAWAAGELNKNNSTFMQTLNEAQIGSLERLRTSPGHPFFTEVATKLPHQWMDPRSIQLLTEWRQNGGRAPSSEQQGGPVQYQQHAGSLARGR